MNEAFLLSWSETSLALNQLPTEGVWNPSEPPILAVDLSRPTRTARFNHPESGGRFDEALSNLFREIDINLPVWILMPNSWVSHYRIKIEDLNPPFLIDQFVKWEVMQRLHGDHSEYRLLLPTEYTPGEVDVYIIKSYLLDFFTNAAEKAGVDISGIGIEPDPGEHYSFELPRDLRDAELFKPEPSLPVRAKKGLPPALSIVVIVVAIAGASGWYFLTKKSDSPETSTLGEVAVTAKKITPPTKMEIKPSPVTPTATRQEQPIVEQTKATQAPQEIKPTPSQIKTQVPVSTNSLFSQLVSKLPGGSRIELAVISPVDFRVEIAGLRSPDQWLRELKKSQQFKNSDIIARHAEGKRNITVFRMENSGLTASNKPRNVKGWVQSAQAAGLQAKSRRAWGSYENAAKFVDALWNNLSGFTKIYFAPEKDYWVVTVQ